MKDDASSQESGAHRRHYRRNMVVPPLPTNCRTVTPLIAASVLIWPSAYTPRPAATVARVRPPMSRHATVLAPPNPPSAAARLDADQFARMPIRFLRTPPNQVAKGQIGRAANGFAAHAGKRHCRPPSFAPPPSRQRQGIAEARPRRHHPRLPSGPPGGALWRRRDEEKGWRLVAAAARVSPRAARARATRGLLS